MSSSPPAQLSAADRVMVALDAFPLEIGWRGAVGFCVLPAFDRLVQRQLWPSTTTGLLVFVLLSLAAIRVAAAVLRRLVPATESVRRVWADRRILARKVDSYQWKKLLGFGIGMLITTVASPHPAARGAVAIGTACTVAGVLGWILWARHRNE